LPSQSAPTSDSTSNLSDPAPPPNSSSLIPECGALESYRKRRRWESEDDDGIEVRRACYYGGGCQCAWNVTRSSRQNISDS
jgi:hypothetical protein